MFIETYSSGNLHRSIIIVRAREFKPPLSDKQYQPLLESILAILLPEIKKNKKNGFEKFDVVVDFAGFKINQISLGFAKYSINQLQILLSDKLAECYILNPPSYIRKAYSLLRAFIDKETRNKIKFYKSKKPILVEDVKKYLIENALAQHENSEELEDDTNEFEEENFICENEETDSVLEPVKEPIKKQPKQVVK